MSRLGLLLGLLCLLITLLILDPAHRHGALVLRARHSVVNGRSRPITARIDIYQDDQYRASLNLDSGTIRYPLAPGRYSLRSAEPSLRLSSSEISVWWLLPVHVDVHSIPDPSHPGDQPQLFPLANFGPGSGIVLDGPATLLSDGDGVRLTKLSTARGGLLLGARPVSISRFHTSFRFRVQPSDSRPRRGESGMAFFISSDPEQMLLADLPQNRPSPHSFTVEFSTGHADDHLHHPSDHVAAMIGPSAPLPTPAESSIPLDSRLDDGSDRFAWIEYDGSHLQVRLSTRPERPASPLLSLATNLNHILLSSSARVGFVSLRGSPWGVHDVFSWDFQSDTPPSSPPNHK